MGPQNGVYQDINAHNLGKPGPRPTDIVNGRPLLGFSAENHAADFQGNADGGNDVALFPDDGNLNMSAGGAFTLEAWVKGSSAQEVGPRSSPRAPAAGMSSSRSTSSMVRLSVLRLEWAKSQHADRLCKRALTPDDTWQHVVAVMDIGEGSHAGLRQRAARSERPLRLQRSSTIRTTSASAHASRQGSIAITIITSMA